MRQSHREKTCCPLARRVGGVAALVLCGLLSPSVPAADTISDSLQCELRQLFPPPADIRTRPPVTAPAPRNPYAITEKNFLLTRPTDRIPSAAATSLLRIRNYPPSLRQAHAACVKIITPFWHGAGIMISADGEVLTSYHLLAGAAAVTVQMLDGRLLAATNVASCSALHDLALLRVEGGPFAFLPVSREIAPAAGNHLSIVGHPGDLSWKLNEGTAIRLNAESGTDVLHFDADIGPGNSGGPVVDAAGRLCAITTCAATLADGSSVKVGVSAKAIRTFLSAPRRPATLSDLAAAEKNRRSAEFLQSLCLLTGEWMHDWLTAMSRITIVSAGTANDGPDEWRSRFLNMDRAAEVTLKLLLLKTMIGRGIEASPPDPALIASGTGLNGAIDRLLDCAMILDQANGKPAADVRLALNRVRQNRSLATTQFTRAITDLEQAGRALELDQVDPTLFLRLDTLRNHYAPADLPFKTSRSEGRS